MKITHIIPALTKGGAERVVVTLANEATRAGHDVTVVAALPVDPALLQHELLPEVTVRFVGRDPNQRIARYVLLVPWVLSQWRWLRDQDVIHCHLTFGAIAGTLIAARRNVARQKRPQVVETFHAVGMPIKRWQQMLPVLLAKGRDGFALMARDSYWSEFAARHPRLNVAIIPNGIITDAPPPRPDEIAAFTAALPSKHSFRIGTVGRIVSDRDPLTMVEAFAEVARALPAAAFTIGGEGPLLEAVRKEAARLGFGDRLYLPGRVERPAALMAALDIYVTINVGAITGIAGLEAVALGVPVVALQTQRNHDGHADWIWSDCDPTPVAAEVCRLAADPAERRALATRQHAHLLAHFSAAAMHQAYEDFYHHNGSVT